MLDMDGVVADWTGHTCKLFGQKPEDVLKRWNPGDFDIEPALGVTSEELWNKIDAAGQEWWSSIPEFPWAKDLYEYCNSMADVVFLSTPSNDPASLDGKVEWLQRFTGNNKFRNYILTPQKHKCASPDHILVDDSDKNIIKFTLAGGKGIVFPQTCNSMHWHKDQVGYVMKTLRDTIAGKRDL